MSEHAICPHCGKDFGAFVTPPQQTPQNKHEEGNYGYCKKCGHSIWNGELCPGTMGQPSKEEITREKANELVSQGKATWLPDSLAPTQPSKEGWEERFDSVGWNRYENLGCCHGDQCEGDHDGRTKSFIQSLLKEERGNDADLLEDAWGIIANAHQSDWSLAQPEWKKAAERWRGKYFQFLDRLTHDTTPPQSQPSRN